jgi:predicted ArsR family transcriptional regulator
MIDAATNAVVGQLMSVPPPISATMLGNRVAVISTFIECRSTPPNSTASGSSKRGTRRVDQLGSVSVSCKVFLLLKSVGLFYNGKVKKAISFFIAVYARHDVSSDNSNRILYALKSRGTLGARVLGRALGITEVGVRQHLAKLYGEGLVAFDDQAGEIGRPKRQWRLTAKGHGRFPDTHGDLTVSLIAGIRSVFGQAGLDRLIEARQEAMIATYRQALLPYPGLGDRVSALAQLRTAEGYMAASEEQSDGSFLLIENHCPICAAAKACQGFCRSELELFRATFGADASVTRQEHLLSDGRRCVYRIKHLT